MKLLQIVVLTIVCCAVTGVFLAASSEASTPKTSPHFGMDVVIEPDPDTAGAVRCSFHVTDLDTQKPVANPVVTTLYGQTAAAVNGDANGLELRFRALADRATGKVITSMTARDGGREFAHYTSETTVPRETGAN